MDWYYEIIIAVTFFSAAILSMIKAEKNFGKSNNVGIASNLVFSLVAGALALLVITTIHHQRSSLMQIFNRTDVYPWVILFGILFFLGNYFYYAGITKAPNAGYARALASLEVVMVAIGAILIFNDQISWKGAIGIALTILGVIIISFDRSNEPFAAPSSTQGFHINK